MDDRDSKDLPGYRAGLATSCSKPPGSWRALALRGAELFEQRSRSEVAFESVADNLVVELPNLRDVIRSDALACERGRMKPKHLADNAT